MSNDMLLYLMAGVGIVFFIIVVAYLIIMKKLKKDDYKLVEELTAGTKQKKYSSDITYQKLYLRYSKIPFLKRYVYKLRRRLEIVNIDDEYATRGQAAKAITKALITMFVVTIAVVLFAGSNFMLLSILLIFELFLLDTLVDGMADKIDNKLLRQQIDFFAEIRHAYHETSMVEEAIYEVSQQDDVEVSRQGEKIYEVLISDDPEMELEKYYDVAPNSYLKEFAGISYLTREFGDRQVEEGSLFLKNVNNITQELQLEILKRDKLDYVFQSLAVIAALPILFLEPVKGWAVSQFSFTNSFYSGKAGLIVQVLLIIITFMCYILTRKLKDNGKMELSSDNPWQAKFYANPIGKRIVNLILPKAGSAEHRKTSELLKKSASKLKIEWLYVNRLVVTVLTFVVSFLFFIQIHRISIQYVYTEPTTDYNIMGQLSEKDYKKAMEVTESDNRIIEKLKGDVDIKQQKVEVALRTSRDYIEATDDEIALAAVRIMDKLKIVNSEYVKWFEVLLAMGFATMAYFVPIWLLLFSIKMRQMEMENEVMQFQTIIQMLMRIERVNVEMILEWLERYANIFKEPITTCVNYYEAGAWEALEVLKQDVMFPQLIRIVESLQSAVEKIPIKDAFDELDTERAYYQEKRKESNERLISKKAMIGKVIGFAPMVCLFVGYLIVPLVFIGMMSMTSSMTAMTAMT